MNFSNSTILPPVNRTYSTEKTMWKQLTIATYWTLFVVIFIFNLAVIIRLLALGKKRSRLHFFVLNIAISDFLFGLFFVLCNAILMTTDDIWYADIVTCKIIKFLTFVVGFGSNYIIVAVSIDRLEAIVDPFGTRASRVRQRILIVAAWVASIIFSVQTLVNHKLVKYEGSDNVYCMLILDDDAWMPYITLTLLGLVFIPLLIIAGCYIAIVILIWQKSSFAKENSKQPTVKYYPQHTNGAQRGQYHVVTNMNSEQKSSQSRSDSNTFTKAKIKSIKVTLVIVSVFLVSWGPYGLYNLLGVHRIITTGPESSFIQALACLNSAANPIVYILFNLNLFKKSNGRPLPSMAVSSRVTLLNTPNSSPHNARQTISRHE